MVAFHKRKKLRLTHNIKDNIKYNVKIGMKFIHVAIKKVHVYYRCLLSGIMNIRPVTAALATVSLETLRIRCD